MGKRPTPPISLLHQDLLRLVARSSAAAPRTSSACSQADTSARPASVFRFGNTLLMRLFCGGARTLTANLELPL